MLQAIDEEEEELVKWKINLINDGDFEETDNSQKINSNSNNCHEIESYTKHNEDDTIVHNSNLIELNNSFFDLNHRLSRKEIQDKLQFLLTEVDVYENANLGEESPIAEQYTPIPPYNISDDISTENVSDDDTDLEIDFDEIIKDGSKASRSSESSYHVACQSEKVVPVSYFLKRADDQEFIMRFHGLGPKGTRALSVPLGVYHTNIDELYIYKNTSIEHLNLEGNAIEKDGATSLANILIDNNCISELILPENSIGNKGTKALCKVLENNQKILKLDLSGNNIDDEGVSYIHSMLLKNSTLKHLFLRYNKMEERGAKLCKEILANNESLETLDISWNRLQMLACVSIAEGLKENIGLKNFYMSMNGLGDKGSQAIGDALKTNRTLLLLDTSFCRIPYEGAKSIAAGLHSNDILHTLNLGSNPLSADGAEVIINALDQNDSSALSFLDLSNVLVKESFHSVHEKIQNQRPLTVLLGGLVKDHKILNITEEDELAAFQRDPMTKLKEYVNRAGLRLIDLFKQFDKDQSMTVSREEFTQGIQETNIPLSQQHIEILLAKLDNDGDGQIDYGELVVGDKEHRMQKRQLNKAQTTEKAQETRTKPKSK